MSAVCVGVRTLLFLYSVSVYVNEWRSPLSDLTLSLSVFVFAAVDAVMNFVGFAKPIGRKSVMVINVINRNL